MTQHTTACFGEILWDILPSGAQPGGAPMNVAYHLHKLGMNPAVITRIGKDEWGSRLTDLLQQQGVPVNHVQTDEEHTTGLVHAHLKENNVVEYDIAYPAAWDFIEFTPEVADLVSRSSYFVFGSLAARSKVSRNTLLKLIEAAGTKVLDINLRPPHYTQSAIETLLHSADILKLNDEEVKIISAWYQSSEDIRDGISLLQDKFSIPIVLVTCGSEGAIVKDEQQFYQHGGFQVKVADTVGSGDAFLAGFLSQYHQGADMEGALMFANKMGAFIATHNGACPDYNLSQLNMMFTGNSR